MVIIIIIIIIIITIIIIILMENLFNFENMNIICRNI